MAAAIVWSEILLFVLLVIGGIILGIGMMREFGHGGDDRHYRCPACGTDELDRVDPSDRSERLAVLRCQHCGTSFRRQLDGTLVRLPPESVD
jgi:DNA-directed RNA polymerase subunit RPC12/RpoP